MSKVIPNSFQCPNTYVDEIMQYLTGDELKVLLFAIRHIFGWDDVIERKQNRISLTVFESGFVTKKGKVFAGTGLSRPAITTALRQLTKYRILLANGKANKDGTLWKVSSEPDVKGLIQRADERSKANQKRTEKATIGAVNKRSTGTSHVPDSSTSHVPANGTPDVPITGTSHVHIQSHLNPLGKDAPAQKPQDTSLKESSDVAPIQTPPPPIVAAPPAPPEFDIEHARTVLDMPSHIQNFEIDNMKVIPLIRGYERAIGEPFIPSRKQKLDALRAMVAGYTEDEAYELTERKYAAADEDEGYPFAWMISDLPQSRKRAKAAPIQFPTYIPPPSPPPMTKEEIQKLKAEVLAKIAQEQDAS